MTTKERKEFIKSMMSSLTSDMIKSMNNKVTDKWDGVELRWYIEDYAKKVSIVDKKGGFLKRYKDYKRIVLEHNL